MARSPLLQLLLLASLSKSELVLPKCCKIGESLAYPTGGSQTYCSFLGRDDPRVAIHSWTSDGSLIEVDVPYRFVWRELNCTRYRFDDPYHVLKNGSIHRDGYENRHDFCLENFVNLNSGGKRTLPLFCSSIPKDEPPAEKFAMNALGLFLSVPFSLATVLAFALIKELASLHGSIVIRYMLCHASGSLIIGLADLQVIGTASGFLCTAIGYTVQFFIMSTFFWLNVMCFDIFTAFRGLHDSKGRLKEDVRNQLTKYSLYAWLTPLVILMVTVFMDQYRGIPERSVFKPRMGVGRCFFKEKTAQWIYFYSPIAVIILCNIVLFAVTAYRIGCKRRKSLNLNREDSQKHNGTSDKESFEENNEEEHYLAWYQDPSSKTELFSTYLKLLILMGINWVLELLSSIFYINNVYWDAVDLVNAMEGVFFFFILVWNKRNRDLVWAKLCNWCRPKV